MGYRRVWTLWNRAKKRGELGERRGSREKPKGVQGEREKADNGLVWLYMKIIA